MSKEPRAADPTERALTAETLARAIQWVETPEGAVLPPIQPFYERAVAYLAALPAERAALAPEGADPHGDASVIYRQGWEAGHKAGLEDAARAEPGLREALDRIFEAFDKSNNVPMFLASTIRHERAALEALGEPQEAICVCGAAPPRRPWTPGAGDDPCRDGNGNWRPGHRYIGEPQEGER